jgi:glucose/arabinose dehydrogenase
MRPASRVIALATLLVTLSPWQVRAADPRNVRVSLVRVASGLVNPVAIAATNDGTSRLFIVEQDGRIRVRTRSGLVTRPYLDIRSRVRAGGERGLLGLAFHPRFASNGNFFVAYNDADGDVRISRFHATPSANVASSSSEVIFLDIPHRQFGNHNGGQVAFGPDGYLYAGIGDGGGAGDPNGNAQDLSLLLGKIIRVDVNRACSGKRYCIPSGNPFAGSSTRAQEIWHFGLRNPWRFSFDRKYGSMWIGDVGQGAREEVDSVASGGGRNFGWDCREGTLDTSTTYGGSYCAARASQFQRPTYQYATGSNGRCAIIGGYRYRGRLYPAMAGMYIYGDYCTGEMWALAGSTNAKVYDHPRAITSFGESAGAELFVVDTGGNMYRVTARLA